MQFGGIAVADIADEVRPPQGPLKKRGVHFRVDEPRHWAAIKPQGAGRDDEISPLKGAISESSRFNKGPVSHKPGTRVRVGKKFWEFFVKLDVLRKDGRDRG